jgi:aryl-alcohol dehydrogenase-like predicted oxidoreductase
LGKVRYIGASAYASWQLAHANVLAELRGWTPFVVLQSEYNLLDRSVEREVLPYCRAHRVGFVPYHPLAGGFLTGKYEKGKPSPAGSRGERDRYVQRCMTDRNYTIVKNLVAWADSRGRRINELAQAWLLAQPQVCSVITGATKVEHVLSNVDGADWALTAKESEEVSAILKGDSPDSR